MNIYIFLSLLFVWFVFLLSIFYKTYKQNKSLKIWKISKNKNLIYISYILLFLSFILLLISAFFTDYTTQNNNWKSNEKVLFLLDVSKSMKALDYNEWNKTYSRLDTAKKWISDFVSNAPNISTWLNVFAWEVVWIMPIMNSSDTFLTFLYWVDENNLSKQGTNIYDSILYSIERFDKKDNSKKSIFLISDWGDELEKKDFSKIKKSLDEQKIKLYIIWIWSKRGSFIPLETDYFGQTTYKTYNSKKVVTKLNSDNLQNIASKLGTTYSEISSYWDKNYEQIIWKNKNFINLNIKETRFFIILSYILFLSFTILFFYNKFAWRK